MKKYKLKELQEGNIYLDGGESLLFVGMNGFTAEFEILDVDEKGKPQHTGDFRRLYEHELNFDF